MPRTVSGMRRDADAGMRRDLRAAHGVDIVAHEVIADERADVEIRPAHELDAAVDAAVDQRAALVVAQRRGIRHDDRREILVLELAAEQAAAAEVALDEPAVVEVEARVGFAGEDIHVVVVEARNQDRARGIEQILLGLRAAEPEPHAELADIARRRREAARPVGGDRRRGRQAQRERRHRAHQRNRDFSCSRHDRPPPCSRALLAWPVLQSLQL